eukprot:2355571-Karenia_brevis.AAC.1
MDWHTSLCDQQGSAPTAQLWNAVSVDAHTVEVTQSGRGLQLSGFHDDDHDDDDVVIRNGDRGDDDDDDDDGDDDDEH